MELVRYNEEKFTNEEDEEFFIFGEKPKWAWKHLGGRLTSNLYDLYASAWITYRIGCPYGICDPPVVIAHLKTAKGLSSEMAEYITNKVFEVRDKKREDFEVWLEKQKKEGT